MDTNKLQSLQDEYLNQLRKDHTQVSIYLVNGVRLNGKVEAFDTYTIMLKDGVTQAVFKHAISTIMPNVDSQLRTTERRLQPRRYTQ
jgi:host factor-I protein